MQSHFNLEVVMVSIVAFFMLLFSNLGYACELDDGFYRTVYELEALHSSPKLSKASHSRFYGKRYYGHRSKRNYYRGNRYYRGGNSYDRSNRYYKRGNRYYYPSKRYNMNRYNYRYRNGH